MARLRRFLACFRVHDEQKTTKNYERGRKEMQILRRRSLGRVPSQRGIYLGMLPNLVRRRPLVRGSLLSDVDIRNPVPLR